MLLTPLPGVPRNSIVSTLTDHHSKLINLRNGPLSGKSGSYQWLVDYLDWVNTASQTLCQQVKSTDVDRLVLTKRYELLLSLVAGLIPQADNEQLTTRFVPSSAGNFEPTQPNVVVNGLLATELSERTAAFGSAIIWLQQTIARWSRLGVFMVLDTSVYMTHPKKFEDLDLAQLLSAADDYYHLLVPMVVVEELDNLKQRGDKHGRWRAAHSLAFLDKVLQKPSHPGTLRFSSGNEQSVELLFDTADHVRLPVNDDEIIERTLAAQGLAGRPVTLITYDTNQSFKARVAGLTVLRLPHPSEEGDEPAKSSR